MQCAKCGTSLVRGVDECPSCGEPAFRKDKPRLNEPWREDEKRREDDLLRQVNYEAQRYGLMPKLDRESVIEYRDRIDREKTLQVIAEMEGRTGRWQSVKSSQPDMQRGYRDECEFVYETAAQKEYG